MVMYHIAVLCRHSGSVHQPLLPMAIMTKGKGLLSKFWIMAMWKEKKVENGLRMNKVAFTVCFFFGHAFQQYVHLIAGLCTFLKFC